MTENNINIAKNFFLLGMDNFNKGNYIESEEYFLKSLELLPNRLSTLTNLSAVLIKQFKFIEAVEVLKKTITLYPNNEIIHLNLGNAYKDLKRFDDALNCFRTSISLNNQFSEGYLNLGNLLQDLSRFEEAISSYNSALSINYNFPEVYYSRGSLYEHLKLFDKALLDYNSALELKPNLNNLFGRILSLKSIMCNWIDYEKDINALIDSIIDNKKLSAPFPILSLSDSLSIIKKANENWVENYSNSFLNSNQFKVRDSSKKIKIGYFSADFKEHPVGYLMAELITRHDRDKFEILGFSLDSWPESIIFNQFKTSFDQFFEVKFLSDLDIALLSRKLNVDIVVDLHGHTLGNRFGIFSYRAASIQVNFLGYPGTSGASFMDYIIADKYVVPENSKEYYSEKICYLPTCCMPYDTRKKVSRKKFLRSELDLPDNCFVFASFNNSYKITPIIFQAWMEILIQVQNSVLWISSQNQWSITNLKLEAIKFSVDPSRLIFAEKINLIEDHLERLKHADLILDTFPYNGHTTTLDCLWSGVPVLTIKGNSFPSRVASSILNTLNITELITSTQKDYVLKAVDLALNPDKLKNIKAKIVLNTKSSPLFNSSLFAKNLEHAYFLMWQRYRKDLQPDHVYISIDQE